MATMKIIYHCWTKRIITTLYHTYFPNRGLSKNEGGGHKSEYSFFNSFVRGGGGVFQPLALYFSQYFSVL